MIVEVTEFIRPNGRQVKKNIQISDSLSNQYAQLTEEGCILTAEQLRTGEFSICIDNPDVGDFDSRITFNGSDLVNAFENMIGNFTLDGYRLWEREMRESNADW